MEIVRIIIADDHVIFRKGLRTVLNEITFIKVVAEASNGNELLSTLKTTKVDVIFMDIKMPGMNGIETTGKVMVKYPDTSIIALTMHEEVGYFNKMIEAGAVGFLLKKTNKDQLENAIKAVVAGNTFFAEEFIINNSLSANTKPTLNIKISDKEKEILVYICKGFSNAEIAKTMGLSQRTIDGHRGRLFEKTGAKNAPNLVLFAIQNGLIKA